MLPQLTQPVKVLVHTSYQKLVYPYILNSTIERQIVLVFNTCSGVLVWLAPFNNLPLLSLALSLSFRANLRRNL